MRHTRADVIARTEKEFAELDRLVKRLKAADWRRRVPRPEGKDRAHPDCWQCYRASVEMR